MDSNEYLKISTHLKQISIFPHYLINESFTSKKSIELFGHNIKKNISHVHGKEWDLYFIKKDFENYNKFLINKLQDQEYFDKIVNNIEKQYSALKFLFSTINKTLSRKLSQEKLFDLWGKYNTALNTFRVYAAIPNYLSFGGNSVIDEYKDLINKRISNKDFSLLTANTKLTDTTKSELALLQIIKNKEKNKINTIKNWITKYGYIYYYYTGPLPTIKEVQKMIKQLRKTYTNLQTRIDEIKNYSSLSNQKIKKVEKKYKLNKQAKPLANVLRFFSLYKVQRKEFMQKSYVVIDNVLIKIAKQNNITLSELKMFSYNELRFKNILQNKNKLRKIAKKRLKEHLIISTEKELSIIDNPNEIKKIITKINTNNKSSKTSQGMVVSVGTTVCAKIIFINNKEDMEKVEKIKEDFILASNSTYPELLPAMAKSVGIITKIGGMTSHAAITAREMKKPCIVGYSALNEDFSEMDTVKLNTKQGTIKKIIE
jgi:phosphohistidine swiveling domain-containing protein